MQKPLINEPKIFANTFTGQLTDLIFGEQIIEAVYLDHYLQIRGQFSCRIVHRELRIQL